MHSTAFTVALAAFAAQAEAFYNTAHMLIARRAQAILEEQNPEVYKAASDELVSLKQNYTDITGDEGSHPFTECATFADHIKGMGYYYQSDWHFIDQPYLDEPGTTLDDFNFTPADVDVVDALIDLTGYMKGEVAAADSTYISQIVDSFPAEADQRSFVLRLLIHYVGDVHQPEHATSLIDSKFPEGDRGGNSEHFDSVSGVDNLHGVWDSVIFEWTGKNRPPLNDYEWTNYTDIVTGLASKYPVDQTKLKDQDFNAWAAESLELAKDYVYAGFSDGEQPSQEYKNAATPICEERLMYAGARLAALLVDLYGEKTAVIKPVEFLQ